MAIAPITGETPVKTALNDLESFRYSLMAILVFLKLKCT
jgi:hypothetical protein